MTEQQLRDEICFGSYQPRLAKAYGEFQRDTPAGARQSKYQIQVYRDANDLLRVYVRSRFSKSTDHIVWLQWAKKKITGWFSQCACGTGARTIGCCAHVAAVIWYLAIARHEPDRYLKTRRDWSAELIDAERFKDVDLGAFRRRNG